MTTGSNFKVENGRVQWWKSLISGDELLTQDHEARMHSRQGAYRLYAEYGNPFVNTMSSEISKTERDMRLLAETKECTLQDDRFVDCVVDPETIVEDKLELNFKYEIIKADGGIISQSFSSS